jgi:tetratricopeptide (TPR) repeat protein
VPASRRLQIPAQAFACALLLMLGGCVSPGPAPANWGASPASVELEHTPFFPQQDDQCGPAALATVLAAAGLPVTPAELQDEVYLPGRRGSLQAEVVAAARSRGRLPYLLPPQPEALLAELQAGRPVLVLQKLGVGPWPLWHYAVLVGIDAAGERVLLRSGVEQRFEMPASRFLASWTRAGRWALVTLRPGELPATPLLEPYMEAAAGLEALGRFADAERAYAAAAVAWPESALPRLGLANVAYVRGDLPGAERDYRAAVALDPQNVVVLNNRAETLLRMGCPGQALRVASAAQSLASGGPFEPAVRATLSGIAADVGPDRAGCPPN